MNDDIDFESSLKSNRRVGFLWQIERQISQI